MNIIVCLDDRNGLTFSGRRQSRDRVLCQRVLDLLKGKKLWVNEYSSELFPKEAVIVEDDPLFKAQKGDYCFAENLDIEKFSDKIEEIIVYRWNRHYPSTVKFNTALLEERSLKSSYEFKGYSHEKITEEVYIK